METLENVYKKIIEITGGQEIIPSYDKRKIPPYEEFTTEFDSPEGKIDVFMYGFLDFDGDDFITDEKLSDMDRAEKKFFASQKKIKNLKTILSQVEEKIIALQAEQAKIFELVMKNGFTKELQKRGQELQEQKNQYDYLKKLFESYEQILINDEKYFDENFQETFRMIFSQRLKQARTSNNLTCEKLAELVGLKRLSIWKYETGIVDPTSFTLVRLSRILNVKPNWLLGVDE